MRKKRTEMASGENMGRNILAVSGISNFLNDVDVWARRAICLYDRRKFRGEKVRAGRKTIREELFLSDGAYSYM